MTTERITIERERNNNVARVTMETPHGTYTFEGVLTAELAYRAAEYEEIDVSTATGVVETVRGRAHPECWEFTATVENIETVVLDEVHELPDDPLR